MDYESERVHFVSKEVFERGVNVFPNSQMRSQNYILSCNRYDVTVDWAENNK